MARTVLLVSPDYASHFNPLVPIGQAFLRAGYSVVVATGQALKEGVEGLRFEHVELKLGEESNDGLISAKQRRTIRRSLEATRKGWCEALEEQAHTRVDSFLWRGEQVAERTLNIIEEYRPDCIIAVQLTFAATAALIAREIPFVTFVTGHPSQLPAIGEIYGFPYTLPAALLSQPEAVNRLLKACEESQNRFTSVFNSLLQRINRETTPVSNGLAAASPLLAIFNYPPGLYKKRQYDLPQETEYIGASVRHQPNDPEIEAWISEVRPDLPIVYFSFGSYFSAYTDILNKIAEALFSEPVRVLFASGLSEIAISKHFPSHWLVRSYFPQIAVLRHCDLVVCHGGNNTVVESLAAGVPLVIAPFASDQFGNAATVELHSLGCVFDPIDASVNTIRTAIRNGLAARKCVANIGYQIRTMDGPQRTVQLCEQVLGLN